MKNTKKLLKLLTVVTLLVAFVLVLPPVRSEAAKTTTYVGWWYQLGSIPRIKTNRTIEIEVGQSFELAPYFLYQTNTYSGSSIQSIKTKTGDKLSMTFVSSKPAVASVKKKTGAVTAKKVGTTKITATYKGKKYVCTLKVKKKGSLGMTTTYKKLSSAAKALAKYQNTKITSKNIGTILPKYVDYLNQQLLVKKDVLYGFEWKTDPYSMTRLVVPSERQAEDAEAHVSDYLYANDPSSVMKISSASGKNGSGSIAVKLKKAPSKTQVNILQIVNQEFGKTVSLSSQNAKIVVEVYCDGYCGDDEDNPDYWGWTTQSYYGTCKVKAGTVSATISDMHDFSGNKLKLKKDYKYRIKLNEKEVSFIAK